MLFQRFWERMISQIVWFTHLQCTFFSRRPLFSAFHKPIMGPSGYTPLKYQNQNNKNQNCIMYLHMPPKQLNQRIIYICIYIYIYMQLCTKNKSFHTQKKSPSTTCFAHVPGSVSPTQLLPLNTGEGPLTTEFHAFSPRLEYWRRNPWQMPKHKKPFGLPVRRWV